MLGRPTTRHGPLNTKLGPMRVFADQVLGGFASIVPADADVSAVADAIVKVVDTRFAKRPFRVHIDPTQDGAEVVNAVLDRVRAELLRRIGLGDLLIPRDLATPIAQRGLVASNPVGHMRPSLAHRGRRSAHPCGCNALGSCLA